jgi:hypothetical protein
MDFSQVLKRVYDATANAIRTTGIGGSLDAQVTWDAALGAMTHVLGPTDQDLTIAGAATKMIAVGSPLEFTEQSDAAAPAANKGRLYLRDNGAGKTQLVVRFPTGAVQVIATEP